MPLGQSVSSLHTHYIIVACYVWYTASFDSVLSWWQCIAARPCADPAFKTTQPHWLDVRKKTSQALTLLSYVNRIKAISKMTDQAAVVVEHSDRGREVDVVSALWQICVIWAVKGTCLCPDITHGTPGFHRTVWKHVCYVTGNRHEIEDNIYSACESMGYQNMFLQLRKAT